MVANKTNLGNDDVRNNQASIAFARRSFSRPRREPVRRRLREISQATLLRVNLFVNLTFGIL